MSSPASRVLLGAPTPCRPSGRTSLPSLGRTARGLAVRSQARGARLPGSWAWSPGCPTGMLCAETTGPPRFLGVPRARMPRSRTPVESRCLAIHGTSMLPSASMTASASTPEAFGALSRSLRAPCVRFAAPVARTPRNTRFRLVASPCRAGLVTRRDAQRVSEFTARASHPPSPGFAWRNTTFDNSSAGTGTT